MLLGQLRHASFARPGRFCKVYIENAVKPPDADGLRSVRANRTTPWRKGVFARSRLLLPRNARPGPGAGGAIPDGRIRRGAPGGPGPAERAGLPGPLPGP